MGPDRKKGETKMNANLKRVKSVGEYAFGSMPFAHHTQGSARRPSTRLTKWVLFLEGDDCELAEYPTKGAALKAAAGYGLTVIMQ